jgi:hypothetical protein
MKVSLNMVVLLASVLAGLFASGIQAAQAEGLWTPLNCSAWGFSYTPSPAYSSALDQSAVCDSQRQGLAFAYGNYQANATFATGEIIDEFYNGPIGALLTCPGDSTVVEGVFGPTCGKKSRLQKTVRQEVTPLSLKTETSSRALLTGRLEGPRHLCLHENTQLSAS